MDRTLNVYALYLNDVLTGFVDKRGDFSSFSEAGSNVQQVIDEFLQERSTNGKTPDHVVIPKTGKVDNAFQTANWKVGFVIHRLADNRVEIHERYVSKPGTFVNSYATRLCATIGCMEIVVPLDSDNAPVRKFVKPGRAPRNHSITRAKMMREFTDAANVAKQTSKEQNTRRAMLIQMTERLHERSNLEESSTLKNASTSKESGGLPRSRSAEPLSFSSAKWAFPVTNDFDNTVAPPPPDAPPAPTTDILENLVKISRGVCVPNVDIDEVKAVVAAREERRAAGEFDDFESLIPPPKPFHEAFLEAIKSKRDELFRPKSSAAVKTPKTERLLHAEITADIQAFEVPKQLRGEKAQSDAEALRLAKHLTVSKDSSLETSKDESLETSKDETPEDELDKVLAMLEEEIEKYCKVPDMLREHTDRAPSTKCVEVSVIRENLDSSVQPTKFEIIDISLPIRQIYQVDLYKHLRRRPTYTSDEGETDSDTE